MQMAYVRTRDNGEYLSKNKHNLKAEKRDERTLDPTLPSNILRHKTETTNKRLGRHVHYAWGYGRF